VALGNHSLVLWPLPVEIVMHMNIRVGAVTAPGGPDVIHWVFHFAAVATIPAKERSIFCSHVNSEEWPHHRPVE